MAYILHSICQDLFVFGVKIMCIYSSCLLCMSIIIYLSFVTIINQIAEFWCGYEM